MADTKISALDSIAAVDAATDSIPIVDASDNQTKRATRNSFLNISSQPLGLTDTQSPTNKTFDNTNTITVKDANLTIQDDADTTKQVKFQVSGVTTGTTRILTIPNVTDTLATLTATQTLTNTTLTSPTINTPTITNPTITTDSISEFTSANGVTIDGVNLKDSQIATSGAVIAASIAASAVTPEKLLSGAGTGWTWQSWTPTWTNLTVGNGTVAAAYVQIGKCIVFRIRLTFGSTTSASGTITFSLPATANSEYSSATEGYILGQTVFLDAGTGYYMGFVSTNSASTTQGIFRATNVGATYATAATANATVPFTFGTADVIAAQGMYEIA